MVFCTFQGQLGWQTGVNISNRLFQISLIEEQLNPTKNIFGKDTFRSIIKSQYFSNPNTYLEIDLVHDIYFCDLVSEIKLRVSYSKTQELMNHLQNEINIFNQLYEALKPKFSQSATELKDLIIQGDKEHFQLKESHNLFKEIKKTQTVLNTLSNLIFPKEVNVPNCGKYYSLVSKSIYICSLLHAIQGLHSWGWEYE